ncbi:MAG: ABC transporter permease [Acidimicrobiia bacterium]
MSVVERWPVTAPGGPPAQRGVGAALAPVGAAFGYWWVRHRHGWRRGLAFGLLAPVLYLVVLGTVMGGYVDERSSALARIGTDRYLAFIGPAVVVSSGMLVAMTDAGFPSYHAFQKSRSYLAMIATPLEVRDVVAGHLLWVAARVGSVSTVLVVVLAAMGGTSSPLAVAIVPVAVLIGVGFAAWISGIASMVRNDSGLLAINRLGTTPMLLFGGVFYPVALLPVALGAVARLTPLWHGGELARALAAGRLEPVDGLHLAWLVATTVLGAVFAVDRYRARLVA